MTREKIVVVLTLAVLCSVALAAPSANMPDPARQRLPDVSSSQVATRNPRMGPMPSQFGLPVGRPFAAPNPARQSSGSPGIPRRPEAAAGNPLTQDWEATYNGPYLRPAAYGAAVAVSASGDVYVAGPSYSPAGDYDFATVRYNASGTQQWAATYDYSGRDDMACAIGIDAAGNAYVTGYSALIEGENEDYQYLTVKFDASTGNPSWANPYGWGLAQDIAVSASGDVFVTGSCLGPYGFVYGTVKYLTGGTSQWVALYDTLGGEGQGSAIALDGSGNIYVTGTISGGLTGADYATVKYDAGGNQLWATRYESASTDEACAIAVDGSGNVCVTGRSYGTSNLDYATVKYNAANGAELWAAAAIYDNGGDDEPCAIAVDASGNVFVTGKSYGTSNLDYATVKYDAGDGHELWTAAARYDNGGEDAAQDIAVDASGNVFVTGYSSGPALNHDYATIKYGAANGDLLWEARYQDAEDQAQAIGLDGSGNAYVTGASYSWGLRCLTVKYNAAGAEQWAAEYNGPGLPGADVFTKVACDATGNVYATGYSNDAAGTYDYVTAKYDANGNKLWDVRYDGGADDQGAGIAVDVSGNVYVTGYGIGSSGTYDYATIKYNSVGAEQWVRWYDGGEYDAAQAIALDPEGNIYVTGTSYLSTSYHDYATVKYDANGNEQWAVRYDGGSVDIVTALAVDASGNACVTGRSYTSTTSYDYLTIKYNASTGVPPVWTARYDGSGGASDWAEAIAVDAAGNVYVTGSSSGTWGDDIVTVKYDATTGNQVWFDQYSGEAGDEGYAIAVDAPGNVCVAGRSYTAAGYSYTTLKYDVAGTRQWAAGHGFGYNSFASAIAIDALGIVYVTGTGQDPVIGTSCATIAYGPDGSELAVALHPGVGMGYDYRYAIALDAAGNVLVAGATPSATGDYDGLVIKHLAVAPPGWFQQASLPPGAKSKNVKDGGALAYYYSLIDGRQPGGPGADASGGVVFAFKGNNRYEFYQYDMTDNTWTAKESIPAYNLDGKKKSVKKGSVLVTGNDGMVYASKGNNTVFFWSYNPGTGVWTALVPTVPSYQTTRTRGLKEGTGAVAVGSDIFLLKGSGTTEFYKYNTVVPGWTTMATAPLGPSNKPFKNGSRLAYDGVNTIYALKGSYNTLYAYDVTNDIWTTRDSVPKIGSTGKKKKVKDGSGMAFADGMLYVLKGGNTNEFFSYNIATSTWSTMADMPVIPTSTKRVKGGGALVYAPNVNALYAFRGNNTPEFFRYGLGTSYGSDNPGQPNGQIGVSSLAAAYAVRFGPNPFVGAGTISYTLPHLTNLQIRLYDITGALKMTLAQGETGPGNYTYRLNAGQLARGVYVLKFVTDDYSTTRKLILE